MLKGLTKSLYDDYINLPFEPSKEKYNATVLNVSKSELSSDENKKYIEFIDSFKEKWALAFRKEQFILGIQTTSRMESLHSMIKMLIRSKCSLPELFHRLVEFANGKNYQKQEEKLDNDLIDLLSKNYILSKIKDVYSDYIYQKCLMSFLKAESYKSTKKKRNTYEVVSYDESNINTFIVTVRDNNFNCTCWYSKQWMIPCLHIFATASLQSDKFSDFLYFNERWLKDFSNTINDNGLIEFLDTKFIKSNEDGNKEILPY